MANITFQLAKGLKQYGLNPKEWHIEWVKADFSKTDSKKQVHRLYVVNQEDRAFYFEAEAVLKKQPEALEAQWQTMQLASI